MSKEAVTVTIKKEAGGPLGIPLHCLKAVFSMHSGEVTENSEELVTGKVPTDKVEPLKASMTAYLEFTVTIEG